MSSQIKRHSDEPFFKPPRTFPARDAKGFPIGKQQERRKKENRKLNKLKINQCELRYPGVCVRNKMLSWAHAVKTRFMTTSNDWQTAARACLPCHIVNEAKKKDERRNDIIEAINRRPASVYENYGEPPCTS